MDSDRKLSRQEFDEIIRRATEMAARESESSELTEAELYRIAGEVGLSERHVRNALTEMRTGGAGAAGPPGGLERLFGPETVRAARVVPGTSSGLARILDEFLVAGQLLQPVRRSRTMLQYRPSIDWISQLARSASSVSRRYYTATAKRVEVRLEELPDEDGRILVEFEVDPGTRDDSIGGSALGAVLGGGGAGVGAGLLLAAVAPVVLAVAAGVVAGTAVAATVVVYTARSQRRKVRDVQAEVEGILDRLEAGDTLEPPPPSWRKWVERQFHGARKLMDDYSVFDEDEMRDHGS